MKQPGQHTIFTAADIERYHAGELSMQQRHALEKAALDDPFLADALEGYENTATPKADLIELQQRLTAKTASKKNVLLIPLFQQTWIRVAALVLLLAGAGWTVYRFAFLQREELAVAKEIRKRNVATADSSVPNKTSINSTAITQNAAPAKEEAITAPAAAVKSKKDNTSLLQRDQAAEAAGIAAAPVVSTEAFKEVEQQKATVSERRVDNTANNSNAFTLNTFRGQIVDPEGRPVPNANIVDNRSRNATTTNTQGQFFLTTPDSVVTATVAAIGFQSNRVNLINPAQEQKVVLNESSNNLSEVVVTGYGKKRTRGNTRPSDVTTKAEVEDLEPEGGWAGFNAYVTQNLHIPEEVVRKQVKGEVQLSFEVDKNGEPVNIKVAKSLCTACDQEAIRLLKEGPGWKKKKKRAGKVTIRF